MKREQQSSSSLSLNERMKLKINKHLEGLEDNNNENNNKKLELCQIGKLLSTFFTDYEILELSERPDFLISNNIEDVGVELEMILDSNHKMKEGFYEGVCTKVCEEIALDDKFQNISLNLYFKPEINSIKVSKKNAIDKITMLVKSFLLTGSLENNIYVREVFKYTNSKRTSINPNFGAYSQRSITNNMVKEYIAKKEVKLECYVKNSVPIQWLILVIGGLNKSSFEYRKVISETFETNFDKVFIYEDFNNQLYKLDTKRISTNSTMD